MTYENLNVTNSGTYVNIMQWANRITDGFYGYGFLLIIFSVIFLGSKRYGATNAHAMLGAGITTTMICGALTLAEITAPIVFTCMAIFSCILLYFNATHS